MQMCWDVARDVWLQRYSENEPVRTNQAPPPRENAPTNQRPQIVDPMIIGCNVITGQEATNAMDSGNYSAE